jgi:hypothetical protein
MIGFCLQVVFVNGVVSLYLSVLIEIGGIIHAVDGDTKQVIPLHFYRGNDMLVCVLRVDVTYNLVLR